MAGFFDLPDVFGSGSKKKAKKKVVKKVPKRPPVKTVKKKTKKKIVRKKKVPGTACALPTSDADRPGQHASESALRRASKKKAKKKAKKTSPKRAKLCPATPPELGDFAGDFLFPEKCGGNKTQKEASRRAQARAWDQGKIPNAWPQPYVPSPPPPAHKPIGPAERKNAIPDNYKDPDLRWFVDPDIAGHRAGKIVVFFSGGKDSLACLLYVIEIARSLGLNPSTTIEAWHHSVDGKPWFFGGATQHAFDWPVTEDYCRAVCDCLQIPLYFSWREGGLMGEVLKEDEATAPMGVELPNGRILYTGGIGKPQTRRSMPKLGSIEGGRWCSSVAKIDVGRSHLANRADLRGKRVLVVSGERAEESAARAGYPLREFEALWAKRTDSCGRVTWDWSGRHGSHNRHVERWRPILRWCEIDVWAIIARWQIRPHPAYRLGWGRLSCLTCIFGSKSMWASIRAIDPKRWKLFVETEGLLAEELAALLETAGPEERKKLLRRRFPYVKGKGKPLPLFVQDATPFEALLANRRLIPIALSQQWSESPIERPWHLPAGAFGEDAGPT